MSSSNLSSGLISTYISAYMIAVPSPLSLSDGCPKMPDLWSFIVHFCLRACLSQGMQVYPVLRPCLNPFCIPQSKAKCLASSQFSRELINIQDAKCIIKKEPERKLDAARCEVENCIQKKWKVVKVLGCEILHICFFCFVFILRNM